MELTNQEILEANMGLKELLKMKLPISVWDATAAVIRELKNFVDDYNQISKALQTTYNVKILNNGFHQMDAIQADVYQAELDKLDMTAEGAEEKAAELQELIDKTSKEGIEKWDEFLPKLTDLKALKKEVHVEKIKLPRTISYKCGNCGSKSEQPLEIEGELYMQIRQFITIS